MLSDINKHALEAESSRPYLQKQDDKEKYYLALFDTQCPQILRGMEKAAGRGGQTSDHKANQGCCFKGLMCGAHCTH